MLERHDLLLVEDSLIKTLDAEDILSRLGAESVAISISTWATGRVS
jgi:hypothetical protein